MANISIAAESPYSEGVPELIDSLDSYQRSLYPPQSTFLLGLEGLNQPEVTFFVARKSVRPVGIGALLNTARGYGEVKRMFVSPEERGRSLGRRLLHHIEASAKEQAVPCLRLETGIFQPAAIAMYKSFGFVERGPFGEYPEDPLNVFMEKTL
jgi:putative acetyltransferase